MTFSASRNNWRNNWGQIPIKSETGKSRRFANIRQAAERKLTQLAAAMMLEFLKSPPGNHLELLMGSRQGQHGIRINKQWRVCFVWTAVGPRDVEIVNYH